MLNLKVKAQPLVTCLKADWLLVMETVGLLKVFSLHIFIAASVSSHFTGQHTCYLGIKMVCFQLQPAKNWGRGGVAEIYFYFLF